MKSLGPFKSNSGMMAFFALLGQFLELATCHQADHEAMQFPFNRHGRGTSEDCVVLVYGLPDEQPRLSSNPECIGACMSAQHVIPSSARL